MSSTFPPIPGVVQPARDEYTGPMIQEPEVWSGVCARCGTRYPVPFDEPHICEDLLDDSAFRSQRDHARRLLKTLLDEFAQFEAVIGEMAAKCPPGQFIEAAPGNKAWERVEATIVAVRAAAAQWDI